MNDVSDTWYYADYKGQKGPLTLEQLRMTLARFSEPENVLVWRDGFAGWEKAGEVAEFKAQTSRPPPLQQSDNMPTWRVKWWWYPIPFPSIAIGSQVGRKVMIWNSMQRRKAKEARLNRSHIRG